MTRVLVWGEHVHEQQHETVRRLYPEGMHGCIADALREDPALTVETATLQDDEHGLTVDRLAVTDVLFWWGHIAHDDVRDDVVDRVFLRVQEGMGFVALHSAHYAKVFRRLLGTTCSLTWREVGERERVWNCAPGHRLTTGIEHSFEVPQSEMYGEPFRIPTPDEQIFLSWFEGGEVFRSGCTWRRGNGKIFYFSPGHETYPIYRQPEVRTVLRNAAHWARADGTHIDACPMTPADQAPEADRLRERSADARD